MKAAEADFSSRGKCHQKKQDEAKGKEDSKPAEQLEATSSSPTHNEMTSGSTLEQMATMLQTFLHSQDVVKGSATSQAQISYNYSPKFIVKDRNDWQEERQQ